MDTDRDIATGMHANGQSYFSLSFEIMTVPIVIFAYLYFLPS